MLSPLHFENVEEARRRGAEMSRKRGMSDGVIRILTDCTNFARIRVQNAYEVATWTYRVIRSAPVYGVSRVKIAIDQIEELSTYVDSVVQVCRKCRAFYETVNALIPSTVLSSITEQTSVIFNIIENMSAFVRKFAEADIDSTSADITRIDSIYQRVTAARDMMSTDCEDINLKSFADGLISLK